MTCICGNRIDQGLAPFAAVFCRECRENPARHAAAIQLARRPRDCPEAGCPQPLELDREVALLRCPMHGPMELVGYEAAR